MRLQHGGMAAPLLVAFLLIAAGCDGGSGVGSGSTNAGAGALASSDFAVLDAEDAFANVEPATLERDAAMAPVLGSDGTFLRPERHPGQAGGRLREILERLDLSADQLEQIRALLTDYRQSIRAALEGLRRVSQPILERANLARAEIVAALEAGEITRDEARRRLHELNRRTLEAIRDNPENEPFLAAICMAKRELFSGIRAIIGEPVRDLWDEWVGTSHSIDC